MFRQTVFFADGLVAMNCRIQFGGDELQDTVWWRRTAGYSLVAKNCRIQFGGDELQDTDIRSLVHRSRNISGAEVNELQL